MRKVLLSEAEKRDLLARILREEALSHEVHPLSEGQKALWFLNHLAPGNPAYHVSVTIALHTLPSVPALRQSFAELVKRHAALRTTFGTWAGVPFQIVRACGDLDFVDLSTACWSTEERDRYAREETRRPFDLEKGPLLRIRLLSDAERGCLLLVIGHDIIGDFWSIVILLDELGSLYSASSRGLLSGLPEVPAQYSDFVRWQRTMLSGSERGRLENYWLGLLSGAVVAVAAGPWATCAKCAL